MDETHRLRDGPAILVLFKGFLHTIETLVPLWA